MPLTGGGEFGVRLSTDRKHRVLEFPFGNFNRLTEGAKDLQGEDGKALVAMMQKGIWPSMIERLEIEVIQGYYEPEVHITVIEKGDNHNASANLALPEQPTAEQLAAARGETITQTAPHAFEVSGVRPTPETPQDWRPF